MLAASLLHASWHALVKASGERVVALAGMNLVSGAAALALVPFVSRPTPLATAVIAGSVLLHGGYKIALARLYTRAEFSQAYPIARGLTPVMAAALGFILLNQVSSPFASLGIVAVGAGIAGLVFDRGEGAFRFPGIGAAVAVGAAVAAYSALDAYGIRENGDWIGFTVWLIACDSGTFVAYAVATRRSRAFLAWQHDWMRTLASGGLGIASFGVFMWALGRAPVGPVAALRETSVVFAAILGAVFLRERMSTVRWVAIALVASGVAAISLAR